MKHSIYKISLLLIIAGNNLAAKENNLFSQFGIGETSPNTTANLQSIGNIYAAYNNLGTINYGNPASYSNIKYTNFEVGLRANNHTTKDGINTNYSRDVNLSYLTLGFPITKWWGCALGISPYSKVNYDVSKIFITSLNDSTYHRYIGNGGLNKYFLGNSFKIKDFSIGFNINYLFGHINKYEYIYYNYVDVFNTPFNNQILEQTQISSLQINTGIQYSKKINNLNYNIGLYYNPEKTINASRTKLYNSFSGLAISNNTNDSLEVLTNTGNIVLPTNYGVGFIVSKEDKWLAGIQWSNEVWSNFKYFNENTTYINTSTISIGGEIKPYNKTSTKNINKAITYRAGLNIGKHQLLLNNNELKTYGVTAGVGMPLRGGATLNIHMEYGKRGTVNENKIMQNYFNMTFGLNISEKWFVRRKID